MCKQVKYTMYTLLCFVCTWSVTPGANTKFECLGKENKCAKSAIFKQLCTWIFWPITTCRFCDAGRRLARETRWPSTGLTTCAIVVLTNSPSRRRQPPVPHPRRWTDSTGVMLVWLVGAWPRPLLSGRATASGTVSLVVQSRTCRTFLTKVSTAWGDGKDYWFIFLQVASHRMTIAQVHCGMVNYCVCGCSIGMLATFSRNIKNYGMDEWLHVSHLTHIKDTEARGKGERGEIEWEGGIEGEER